MGGGTMTDTDLYRLNEEQCARYHEDGFVFLPDLIPDEEITRARDEMAGLCRLTRREVIMENDGVTVRSVMNPHVFSELFARFVRHPRLLGPVRQLLEREVYLFQIILNMKAPSAATSGNGTRISRPICATMKCPSRAPSTRWSSSTK